MFPLEQNTGLGERNPACTAPSIIQQRLWLCSGSEFLLGNSYILYYTYEICQQQQPLFHDAAFRIMTKQIKVLQIWNYTKSAWMILFYNLYKLLVLKPNMLLQGLGGGLGLVCDWRHLLLQAVVSLEINHASPSFQNQILPICAGSTFVSCLCLVNNH